MWTAITLALKAAASGVWSLLRAIPAWVYLSLLSVALIAWGQHRAYTRGHAAGTAATRADLVPKLVTALDQLGAEQQIAADAEGRALALDAGLQQCISTRVAMDSITSAVLTQREQERQQAVLALNTTRQELVHAYSQSDDGCADRPVPAAVLQLLDRAAAPDADSDSERAGAAVRAGAGEPHGLDAVPATCWHDVSRPGGLDTGVVCGIARMQRRQGEHRAVEG